MKKLEKIHNRAARFVLNSDRPCYRYEGAVELGTALFGRRKNARWKFFYSLCNNTRRIDKENYIKDLLYVSERVEHPSKMAVAQP